MSILGFGLWASSGSFPLSAHYGPYKRGRDPPTNPSRHLKKERSDLPLKWLLKEGRGRSPTAAAAAATTAATPCPGHSSSPPSSRRRRPQAAAAASGRRRRLRTAAPPSPPSPASLFDPHVFKRVLPYFPLPFRLSGGFFPFRDPIREALSFVNLCFL